MDTLTSKALRSVQRGNVLLLTGATLCFVRFFGVTVLQLLHSLAMNPATNWCAVGVQLGHGYKPNMASPTSSEPASCLLLVRG
jgi:hypothetical protein